MVSGGMTCIKYILFCFNLLFAISGIAILAVGSVVYGLYYHYNEFVYQTFNSAPIVLIIVGAIVFVVAFFGCCGAVRENHCMIITFSVFVLIIFCLELAAGIAGYVRRNEVGAMLEDRLNTTMFKYYSNPEIRKSWDIMQHEMECCGMNGPEDWKQVNNNNSLPHTCCPNTEDNGSCTVKNADVYKKTCLNELKQVFQKYSLTIGGVGIGITILPLVGFIFACCLARSIRKEYETV